MKATKVRRMSVRYEGLVQGVGFRWTVRELAMARGLTGQVCNEPDGTVTLVVEGPEEAVLGLLRDVRMSRPGTGITGEHRRWSDATGIHKGFAIAH